MYEIAGPYSLQRKKKDNRDINIDLTAYIERKEKKTYKLMTSSQP